MTEELSKIVKPAVSDYKKGRKIYFVPLIYSSKDSPADYLEKCNRYWKQAEDHINELELKLGIVNRVYHELLPSPEEEGLKILKALNDNSYRIVQGKIQKGAQMEAIEDADLLTEFMDWGRCLSIGLQNQNVLAKVYESYFEANKKRNEFITKHIDETLKAEEIGVLFMREGYQVQFPPEIEIFYVAPPALDEINRWIRDSATRPPKKRKGKAAKKE